MPSSRRVWTTVTLFSPDHQDTLLRSCSVYWTLQRVSSLAHASSTTTCHTCCMRNCTQTALTRRPRTYPLQTGSHSASLSAEQGSGVPGRLLYTSLRHSQPTSFTVSHSTSPDHTTLSAQHFRSSGLLCRWSDGLELATGQSLWPGAQRQQLQTIAEDESVSSLSLNTHSAVEMLHDCALYKSIIDIDTVKPQSWSHCKLPITQ